MDFAIHKNFKDLTGYSWKNYWAKIKIQKELEVVSELLGRNAGISDLIDLGFLNMRENTAAALLSGTLLESAVYGDEPFSEKMLIQQHLRIMNKLMNTKMQNMEIMQ